MWVQGAGAPPAPAAVGVSALCCTAAWVAAGTRGGWVSVLDPRSGELLWWFRRHEAQLSALGAYRGHYLVSAAKVSWVGLGVAGWRLGRTGAGGGRGRTHLVGAGEMRMGAVLVTASAVQAGRPAWDGRSLRLP